LTIPRRHDLELNELSWWANWVELQWIGKDAYVMTSTEMPELFFNRGGLLACESVSSINRLEGRFQFLGFRPAVTIYESCSGVMRRLVKAGYKIVDVMTVMRAVGNVPSKESAVAVGPASSPENWSRAYLSAFYGDLELMPVVDKIVRRLKGSDSTTLLEARVGDQVGGVLAIYRSSRLAGVYCVGTVKRFRGRGVAEALLVRARQVASSEGRTLFLQSLRSDGTGEYYVKRGFRSLYRKVLMWKKG
jgi:GNAT superfamily N-acetyltransferase